MTPYRSPWLDDELESFRGTVRRFVTEVLAPREPAWQAAHQVDAASWREVAVRRNDSSSSSSQGER